MQIQLTTDNHLVGSDDFALRLEAEVRTALGRFSDISRASKSNSMTKTATRPAALTSAA